MGEAVNPKVGRRWGPWQSIAAAFFGAKAPFDKAGVVPDIAQHPSAAGWCQRQLPMNFYQKLPSFGDFSEITQNRHYRKAPADWLVVVADIEGSTQAIAEGRYKDINTLGAAAIVAVHSQLGREHFPYVFGGDGATMLIPPGKRQAATRQLRGLQALAREQFGLRLRVGVVPVSELGGTEVEVAKLRIAGNRTLAVFRGGGISKAEELVKRPGSSHLITDDNADRAAGPDIGKLSCRWLPIKPARGHSMCLIVRSRTGSAIYEDILKRIEELYDGRMERANPIHLEGSGYRTIGQCLRDEKRYHRSLWSLKFAWRLVEIVLAVLVFRYRVPAPFSARKYAESLGRHSDYRKFDDMLRMVIDCSKKQADAIEDLLAGLHEAGEIDYGTHLAAESLMTCFFHRPGEGGHVHFVDGGGGGYVMAAKQLKQRISAHKPVIPPQPTFFPLMDSSPLPEIPAVGYLAEVPQEHRQFLTGYGKFVRTTEGERLITEGDKQDTLYLILKGTLHVTSNVEGRAVLLASLKDGDTIGEINIFDPTRASANVTSMGECLIWRLTREELEGLFEADPTVGVFVLKGLMKQLSARIRRMNEKLITSEKEVFFDFWNTEA